MYHERSRSADRGTRSTKFGRFRRASLGIGAYIIGIVASTALVGTLSAPTAQALSPYDNVIKMADKLILRGQSVPPTSTPIDITPDYMSVFSQYCNAQQPGKIELSTQHIAEGAKWTVMQTGYTNDEGYQSVQFVWSFETATFKTEGGKPSLYLENQHRLTLYTPIGLSDPTMDDIICEYAELPFEYILYGYAGSSDPNYARPYQSNIPIDYPSDYEGEIIPDEVKDPLYQDPWNLPAAETSDCDWWNLTCFMGTVDFNPIRDVTQQASQNLGFIAQFGQVIGELTEMMTAMPDFFAGVDPCWTTGTSSWCNIPVNIFGQQNSISLHNIRNSPVMQAIMPWLLYAMMGLMAWNLFKSLPKIVEDITKA